MAGAAQAEIPDSVKISLVRAPAGAEGYLSDGRLAGPDSKLEIPDNWKKQKTDKFKPVHSL